MKLRSLISVIGIVLALNGIPAFAAREGMPEEEIKAAIVFNILLFVEWPKTPVRHEGTFILCTVADSATWRALKNSYDGRPIRGDRISVRNPVAEANELRACDAVFVDGINPQGLFQAAVAIDDTPVLLIGEGPMALQSGAMIGLALSGGRYVFDINLSALKRSALAMSSKLLRLARRVVE